MNALIQSLNARLGPHAGTLRALTAPAFIVMVLAMMVLPLPPWMLDLLFTFNIALALMVMMVAAQMTKPLDFAALPAVLLVTTLLRLSLNVASTRVVLLEGHTGPGAAGQVIEAFGHFLIGGFAIGMLMHDLGAADAARSYVLLAVGDALVAQVPALLVSVSAAMVVSRVGKEQDVGTQIRDQVFDSPQALGMTAGIVAGLGLIPGMPNLVFLLMAAGLAGLAWAARRRHREAAARAAAPPPEPVVAANAEASWDDLQPVDPLGLEVGVRLIALVDKNRGGELLARIKGVRKKFAQEVGFLPPAVHIRDNLLDLKPGMYRVTLRGAVIGEGEAYPGMLLAINPGGAQQQLPGTRTTDPAFGLPAVWIEERHKDLAQMAGFTVVDCPTVVATHLSHLMQVNAAKLLGRVETQALLDHVSKLSPKLVEDVVPKVVGIATVQKVLQLLLEEGVHVRDLRGIVEALGEHAAGSANAANDPAELARRVRVQLAPAIVQQIFGPVRELDVIALDPDLERLVVQALASPHGAALDPGVADTLARHAADSARQQEDLGVPACLLVPDLIRAPLARLLKRAAPRLKVLAHSEVPETHSIRIGSIIGAVA